MVRKEQSEAEPIQVDITIPSISEYVGIVRLAISGIATRMDYSIEEIEDIKIAVSEACTNAVQYAYDPKIPGKVDVQCRLYPDKLEITVIDHGSGFDIDAVISGRKPKDESPDKLGLGLGLTFIRSLMDEADFTSVPGKGTTIRMAKMAPVRTLS